MYRQNMIITVVIAASLFIPLQAAQGQQSSSKLQIVSTNAFNDNSEFSPTYHIVGEVQNNGSDTAKFVEVSATLYDSSNQVIGTDFTFTKPSTIEPGMKAPFEILISKDKVKGGDFSIIDHYSTQVSASQ